ncbi:NAD(P)/FAD-dependent oxidoreductase [Mesosutterella sp. AGMB02718]|uniref:NADH:ubiquinone reductase (non-electrogenic) n=1 Tax=Mesosutterella faecium TaxID=2925194 RepID=A0ABT7IPQ7_9BURK|nr:NAD(P)/FAD-dependent oxidoreductase [Mesosutterella sp. AGMB02718]MDL2059955.1 NAD(P)/FAD-dependent oxidoreductase [Mesosutterella sp. AGMB02718]
MKANIRTNGMPRVVIAGAGLGGLRLAMELRGRGFQVVAVDRNNYSQFSPLIYQVASAGLEPSSISFPLRRLFQGCRDCLFRMAEVRGVDPGAKVLLTSVGPIGYDYLVLAMGGETNFFGQAGIEREALPMKTVEDAMVLRNRILLALERAQTEEDPQKRERYLNFVIVGGGPSGVEIAGALAEMKKDVVPRDYPDLAGRMHIHLLNSGPRLLKSMDPASSARAEKDLLKMGVHVHNGWRVTDCRNGVVSAGGGTLESATVIWVSGIRAVPVEGLPPGALGRGGRILTDRCCRVRGLEDVFAIGDQSLVLGDPEWKDGHPQLAQAALQQASLLARNLERKEKGGAMQPFVYRNLGTMATIGRKRAVAEIGRMKFGGLPAWTLWLVVHLRPILGVKNKFFVLLNWIWNYFTYAQSLRLILRPRPRPLEEPQEGKPRGGEAAPGGQA